MQHIGSCMSKGGDNSEKMTSDIQNRLKVSPTFSYTNKSLHSTVLLHLLALIAAGSFIH